MTESALDAETLESRRFPIGRFHPPQERLTPERRAEMIDRIASAPAELRAAVADLDDQQLDTRYRPDGWTLRQVVHHVADSHVNSYMRFKLTITEDHPTIRTYEEAVWAEEFDARAGDVAVSLALLEALHERWTSWLRTLTDEQWRRTLDHPEAGVLVLDQLLAMYAWHGAHHVAHITEAREREGW